MKCRKGDIIIYEETDSMVLYSFHLENETSCEFDRFIDKFENLQAIDKKLNYLRDLDIVLAALEQIVMRGAREERFRGENSVHALPTTSCNLRLYCIRLHNNALLIGNGGVKSSQKLKDSPDCYKHYELMASLEKEISLRIHSKEMFWRGNYLVGDLHFELGDCD